MSIPFTALISATLAAASIPQGWAIDSVKAAGPLSDYPELQVTPRASERIEREAKLEANSSWARLLQLQIPSILLLTAGTARALQTQGGALSPLESAASSVGIGIGAAGLIGSTWMAMAYHPMKSAQQDLKGDSTTTPRETLAHERLAEESLNAAARNGRILRWTIGSTTLLSSGLLLYQASGDPALLTTASISLAAGLLPLIFPTRWETVACEQELYKKKIYGPVGSAWNLAPVLQSTDQQQTRTALQLSWNYRF
jgi:hypothetical protein